MVEADDLTQALDQLERLDVRESAVLKMRFGVGNEEPRTLKDIGEHLGLTRERVRQIECEALNKLRESLQVER
jgi:RNA polymerase primary sigma factor